LPLFNRFSVRGSQKLGCLLLTVAKNIELFLCYPRLPKTRTDSTLPSGIAVIVPSSLRRCQTVSAPECLPGIVEIANKYRKKGGVA
jgi:hypothetical protein